MIERSIITPKRASVWPLALVTLLFGTLCFVQGLRFGEEAARSKARIVASEPTLSACILSGASNPAFAVTSTRNANITPVLSDPLASAAELPSSITRPVVDVAGDVTLSHGDDVFLVSGYIDATPHSYAEIDMAIAGYDYVSVFDGVDTHVIFPRPAKRSAGANYVNYGTYASASGTAVNYGPFITEPPLFSFSGNATLPDDSADLHIIRGERTK